MLKFSKNSMALIPPRGLLIYLAKLERVTCFSVPHIIMSMPFRGLCHGAPAPEASVKVASAP